MIFIGTLWMLGGVVCMEKNLVHFCIPISEEMWFTGLEVLRL